MGCGTCSVGERADVRREVRLATAITSPHGVALFTDGPSAPVDDSAASASNRHSAVKDLAIAPAAACWAAPLTSRRVISLGIFFRRARIGFGYMGRPRRYFPTLRGATGAIYPGPRRVLFPAIAGCFDGGDRL